jgi:hypothetical protein
LIKTRANAALIAGSLASKSEPSKAGRPRRFNAAGHGVFREKAR